MRRHWHVGRPPDERGRSLRSGCDSCAGQHDEPPDCPGICATAAANEASGSPGLQTRGRPWLSVTLPVRMRMKSTNTQTMSTNHGTSNRKPLHHSSSWATPIPT